MCNKTKITGIVTFGLLFTLLSCSPFAARKDQREEMQSEEPRHPEIHLSRQGHIDVNAKQRVLSWHVSDPSGLAYVDVKIVKIESGTMKAKELYRSDKAEGRVDVSALEQGPGLYGILVKAENNEKEENEAALRLSYAEVNKDCPTNKAWWPRVESAQGSPNSNTGFKEAPYNPYQQNLLSLSRHSKYAVTARVKDLIACPTEEGHLFTYVRFIDVKTLQKEGGPKAEDAPEELILRIPGGMAHGRVELVSDAPVFRKNEQVLLFLTRDPQQQVPIVNAANGVLLLENGKFIRSYRGALVTGINKDFDINLDPLYKPDPRFARHWDPNMQAVWIEPARAKPIGKPQVEEIEPGKPMLLEKFSQYLERAWAEADRRGRLPVELDKSPRRPYGETPRGDLTQGD